MARRDLRTRTGLWGRAEVTAVFEFETKNCPKCGALLTHECARCEEEILAPVVDLCRSCGLPQPWAAQRRAGADRATIRHWKPEKKSKKKKGKERKKADSRVNDPAEPLYCAKGKKVKGKKGKKRRVRRDLWVLDGDVVELDVDAIVSNNDVDGQMWAQVARAIKKAAGEGVERLAQEGKPFRKGDAWVTKAGNLGQMKGIIHVASMDRHGNSSIDVVRQCLTAALRVAAEEEYESIGIAAIGSTLDREEWFEAFAETTVRFLSDPKFKAQPISIVLALFEPPNFDGEVEELCKSAHEAWVRIGEPADGQPEWKPTGNEELHADGLEKGRPPEPISR